MRITSILIIFFLLSATFVHAQRPAAGGPGKIIGQVSDSSTKQAIEYATLSLINSEGKVVDGCTTNGTGSFALNGLPEGKYRIVAYFIGYKTDTVRNLIITASHPDVSVTIRLLNQQVALKEVVVTEEKNIIENKIDKMVYNAEKDITSQGGVATDILKKVPMVSVNADGTIELQGNANIRFLVNGKPSSVFGNNIADVLQTIPASQIQSIEVITSPGAKYDAEGTGGIINIILKKVTIQGVNGNLSLTGGTRLQNGSFNLAVRKGKIGMNAFVSGNAQIKSVTLNTLTRVSGNAAGGTSTLLQDGTSDFTRRGYQAGASFDWAPGDKNNFTGGFTYNNFGNNNIGSTNRESINTDANSNTLSDIKNLVSANNYFNNQAFDWNLNYKQKFKKEGHEMEFLYNSSLSNNYSYYQQTQKFISPDSVFSGSYGKNPGTDMQTNISFNYVNPLTEKFLLETGLKTVLYQLHSNSDVYLLSATDGVYSFNSAQSNTVNYARQVYAAYVSATLKLKFVDLKAGVRNEYTETQAVFSNAGNANIAPYNTIVPSGLISHTFKNNHTLKLSYSYRIQRPDYRDLNPFVNASDPQNLSTGNPALRPETTHNIELGYSKFFEKGININVNAFYRGNRNDIQTYARYYSTYQAGDSTYYNITVSTRENIGREDNFGLNLFASASIKKKFTLRSNMSFFQRYIYNAIVPGANISGFNYRVNLNASYQVSGTFIVEVFGNFNSPRINVQGTMPAFTTYNFALRKQFFHKKMSLAFTTTNPFNKYVNQRTRTTGVGFTQESMRQLPYRSFGLNLTWNFGKLEFKRPRENEDANLTNPPMQGN